MRDAKKRDLDFYDIISSEFNILDDHHTVEETAMERYRRIQKLQFKNEERGDTVKYAKRFSLVIGVQELQVIEKRI